MNCPLKKNTKTRTNQRFHEFETRKLCQIGRFSRRSKFLSYYCTIGKETVEVLGLKNDNGENFDFHPASGNVTNIAILKHILRKSNLLKIYCEIAPDVPL